MQVQVITSEVKKGISKAGKDYEFTKANVLYTDSNGKPNTAKVTVFGKSIELKAMGKYVLVFDLKEGKFGSDPVVIDIKAI